MNPEGEPRLPVHGFVLAGGKSSRMGRDKALLPFRGRPMVEIAVAKLRTICAQVSIVGDRQDLETVAPVVFGERAGLGPGAGMEAGLRACQQPWAMFMPVDVPLVPRAHLQMWVEEALRVDMTVSYLAAWEKQPAFCLLRREHQQAFSAMLEAGERRLEVLLKGTAEKDGSAWRMYDPHDLYGFPEYHGPSEAELAWWFRNVNTPEDLAEAEQRADVLDSGGGSSL